MYYGAIKKFDIADGEGVRVSLFVSGCTNACQGCFQPETWNFNYGQPYTEEVEEQILEYLKFPYTAGLTLLGGDPFEISNQKALVGLCRKVKEIFPDKTIWAYTGFVLDRDIWICGSRHCEVTEELLSYIDVLVDGPFIEEQKDITLKFKGSRNQRVIDLKKTIDTDSIVLYLD